MLYVSKKQGKKSFYITDTDDNSSELVSENDLKNYCINLGIDIAGVTIVPDGYNRPYITVDVIDCIATSANLAKQAMLNGVVMTVDNDGCLVKILTKNGLKTTSIVLSDYCNSVANYVVGDSCALTSNILTLILDDSLDIYPRAFKDMYVYHGSIRVDVSRLTNAKVVKSIYSSIILEGTRLYDFDESHFNIIDTNKTRFYFYIMLSLLSRGYGDTVSSTPRIEELFYYPEELDKLVVQSLRKEWSMVSNASFFWSETKGKTGQSKNCCMSSLKFKLMDSDIMSEWFLLRPEIIKNIAFCIGRDTTVNSKSVKRLTNYLLFCNGHLGFNEAKGYYLKLARKFISFCRREYDTL